MKANTVVGKAKKAKRNRGRKVVNTIQTTNT